MAGKFIKIKSLSGTDVANLNLTTCFNERYNIYEIFTTIKRASGSSSTAAYQRFLDSSGSEITGSNYNEGTWRNSQNSGSYDRVYSTSDTYMNSVSFNDADSLATIRHIISNPYENDRYISGYVSRYYEINSPSERANYGLSGLKDVQTVTGIKTYSTSGNIDVDIAVYAYEAT
tara:strand:- start:926 stop:1447 length:522 start_codon:yes stop_codon:yes gene_type:complete